LNRRRERLLELTYQARVTPWLQLQPVALPRASACKTG
jgi:carbohydrate-selective porin OprB